MADDPTLPALIPGRRHRCSPDEAVGAAFPAKVDGSVPHPIALGDEIEIVASGPRDRVWFSTGGPDDGR